MDHIKYLRVIIRNIEKEIGILNESTTNTLDMDEVAYKIQTTNVVKFKFIIKIKKLLSRTFTVNHVVTKLFQANRPKKRTKTKELPTKSELK